jgi:hypothetical protein
MAQNKDPHWMEKAFAAHPGRLHRQLHVAPGQKIPAKKLAAAKRKADRSGDTHMERELALAARGKAAASGQDDCLLGTKHGKPGGHAGYGQGM